MRPPTADEVARVLHEASGLDVRARGRLAVLRVAAPLGIDLDLFRAELEAGFAPTPLRGVTIMFQEDPGEARVLGGVFG